MRYSMALHRNLRPRKLIKPAILLSIIDCEVKLVHVSYANLFLLEEKYIYILMDEIVRLYLNVGACTTSTTILPLNKFKCIKGPLA